jgi:hypothetical protein
MTKPAEYSSTSMQLVTRSDTDTLTFDTWELYVYIEARGIQPSHLWCFGATFALRGSV